jgi:hypothetical protein
MVQFEDLHSSWLRARSAVNAGTHDDSDVATDRLCAELYAAQAELLQALAPSKDSLRHRFEFLEIAIESSCDGDIMKAIGSIKRDLRGFGFVLQ